MKYKFIFLVFLLLLFTSNIAYAEEISKAEEMIKGSFPNAEKVCEIDLNAKGISGIVVDFAIATNTGDIAIATNETRISETGKTKYYNGTIYYFDKNGNELWRHTTEPKITRVYIAKNGEVICAKYSGCYEGKCLNYIFDRNGILQYEASIEGSFYPTLDEKHLTYELGGFQIYDSQGNPTISNSLIIGSCKLKFLSDNKLLVCKYSEIDRESFSKEFRERISSISKGIEGYEEKAQVGKELEEKYTISPAKIILFEYPSFNLLWEYSLENNLILENFTSTPQVSYNNNLLIIYDRQGMRSNVFCIDRNGNLLWKTKTSYLLGITISTDGNYVLGVTRKTIIILSSETGESLFEKQIINKNSPSFGRVTDLSFTDDKILISGGVYGTKFTTYKCSFSKNLDFLEGEMKEVAIRGLSINPNKNSQFIGAMTTVESYQKIELFENK